MIQFTGIMKNRPGGFYLLFILFKLKCVFYQCNIIIYIIYISKYNRNDEILIWLVRQSEANTINERDKIFCKCNDTHLFIFVVVCVDLCANVHRLCLQIYIDIGLLDIWI